LDRFKILVETELVGSRRAMRERFNATHQMILAHACIANPLLQSDSQRIVMRISSRGIMIELAMFCR